MNPTPRHAPRAIAAVESTMEFADRHAGRPAIYLDETASPATRRSGRFETRPVTVENVRPIARALSLDREGFALMPHTSSVTDFYDETAIKDVYVPELERLIGALMGAKRVLMFDHTRRTGPREDTGGLRTREPVRRIHNDYSEKSGPRRMLDLIGEPEAALQRGRRFAIVNVWRPMRGPLQETPLGLCDATTVRAADWIETDQVYRDRVGETYCLAWAPEQRWYYAPDMTPEEIILIKSYDSALDGRARFCAHSAFDDITAPADAPPRASIEARLLALF